jgi:Leucine-rich repeat (LRR) protein
MKINRSGWLTIIPLLALSMVSKIYAVEFNVQDIGLQACLQKLAVINQWKKPQNVTEIKCHSNNIRSLKGLEKFTKLESLSLYNNNLEKIDINLTSFKHLITLNLSRNNLSQLIITDLSKLSKIYLFDNGMETLTLTNLTSLKVLKANNNKIEVFNYENTPKLEKIYIFNNQLETVNIHDLPNLQYMDCRQNPMPDSLYDEMDKKNDTTFLHDGNAEDW